jgi:hypothetical protein
MYGDNILVDNYWDGENTTLQNTVIEQHRPQARPINGLRRANPDYPALLPGSPAIDAGNPNGCTDSEGHLLTTDQRGWARPGKDDTGGCDMGAFERQKD